MTVQANDGGSVQVLQKAAAILDALLTEEELTAAELAERIGEPRSSMYRLIGSLRELGFVQAGRRRGTVRLGLRMLELGSAVSSRFDERKAALPIMVELGEQTGETIFLCVRRGYDAVCIERVDGEHVRSMELRLGGALPLHAGGASRALLAWQPEGFWDSYVTDHGLSRLTACTITSKRELSRNLREARARGFVVSDGDVTPGIAAVGAPILGHDGGILASISISGTRPLILDEPFERLRDGVTDAARRISSDLGWRPPDPARWWVPDDPRSAG